MLETVMRRAVADLIGVNTSWIHDLIIAPTDRRRLGVSLRAARHLDEANTDWSTYTQSGVKIDFRVVIPPDPEGDVVITPSIILERFDTLLLEEATELINSVIQSNILLNGDSSYSVKVAYKIIRKEEQSVVAPSPSPEGGDTLGLVMVGAASGIAMILMVATIAYCYRLKGKVSQDSKMLLKGRVDAAAHSATQFLFPPSVITLDHRNMLRSFLDGVLDASFAKVFISFAMDSRPTDVEGCGPGAFYAAAVAQALDARGIQVCMSFPGVTSDEKCSRLLSDATATCKVLVIVETVSLYQCSKCLREIYNACESGVQLMRLRFETSLPHLPHQWPEPSHEQQMASVVKKALKLLATTPEAPLTVQLQPEVLETFVHELKLKLSILSFDSSMKFNSAIEDLGEAGAIEAGATETGALSKFNSTDSCRSEDMTGGANSPSSDLKKKSTRSKRKKYSSGKGQDSAEKRHLPEHKSGENVEGRSQKLGKTYSAKSDRREKEGVGRSHSEKLSTVSKSRRKM